MNHRKSTLDIIKGLACIAEEERNCIKCPYRDTQLYCKCQCAKDALDLINCLRAENDALNNELKAEREQEYKVDIARAIAFGNYTHIIVRTKRGRKKKQ